MDTCQTVFDMFDALKSLFPAGTVSGAPKVRAMEIITELEKREENLMQGLLVISLSTGVVILL